MFANVYYWLRLPQLSQLPQLPQLPSMAWCFCTTKLTNELRDHQLGTQTKSYDSGTDTINL